MTVEQYTIENLEEPDRTQILNNCKKQNKDQNEIGNIKKDIFLVQGSFLWSASEEGGDYWNSLYNSIQTISTRQFVEDNFTGILKNQFLEIIKEEEISSKTDINNFIDTFIISNNLKDNLYWIGVKDGINGVKND